MDLSVGTIKQIEIHAVEADRPTFTQICNSAVNWLDYGNSFSGIQMDCLWQTICILYRQLHRESKKQDTKLSPTIIRFSKFFH